MKDELVSMAVRCLVLVTCQSRLSNFFDPFKRARLEVLVFSHPVQRRTVMQVHREETHEVRAHGSALARPLTVSSANPEILNGKHSMENSDCFPAKYLNMP